MDICHDTSALHSSSFIEDFPTFYLETLTSGEGGLKNGWIKT